ncbi:MAG: hypothetical protein AAB495_03445 [Patescibacteria group bacterium]|mgnify:CR=1 FL=1
MLAQNKKIAEKNAVALSRILQKYEDELRLIKDEERVLLLSLVEKGKKITPSNAR